MKRIAAAYLHGPLSLAASFGSRPVVSSLDPGWKELAVCSWRVAIDEYEVGGMPEALLGLHTEGIVHQRLHGRWDPRCSVPGQLTLIPPGARATYRCDGMLGVTTVHLGAARFEQLLGEGGARRLLESLRMQMGFQDPLLASLVAALAEEARDPGERGPLYADTLADALALRLLRKSGDEIEHHSGALAGLRLRRVLQRIEEKLDCGVSLGELAAEARLSRCHFSRAFKAAMGQPPHRYLMQRRLERAKTLLRESPGPLADIALAAGFASQSHMADCFRRWVGVSPAAFRRAH